MSFRFLRIVFLISLFFIAPAHAVEESDAALPSKEALLSPLPHDVILGEENAPVTMIEYASLSCSHCATFHNRTFPKIKERYVDTGKVRFIYRDFPLDESALRASMFARCAPDDKFGKFLQVLFSTQNNWVGKKNYLEILSNIGKLGGMTGEAFDACMQNTELENTALTSRLHAAKILEVNSTPSFFINGEAVRGAVSFESLSAVIDGALNTSPATP